MDDLAGQAETRTVGDPIWARNQPQRRPALTREAIVAAAMAVADAEGLEAVSMRRVAAELGARTMSLYTHIDRKEDLLDLMADEMIGEVLVEEAALSGSWRDAISAIVRRERDAYLRHPWMSELIGKRSRVGPNTLRHLEQSLTALDELNVDLETAIDIVGTVDHYMLGHVMVEVAVRCRPEVSLGERAYLEELVRSGDYPRLAPLLRGNRPKRHGDFERGLQWLLDGIERELG
jgi:AcrR family transcriptional regulator